MIATVVAVNGGGCTGYIEELRALCGHRPLIFVGANVVVLDDADRVLLQLRADTGDWGLPGGFMEPGESVEQTARREVLEETGLELGAMDLLGIFSGPAFFYQYPNGDQVYGVAVAYVSRDFCGEPAPTSSECRELRFFASEDLPDAILPVDRPIVEAYFNGRRQS